MTVNQEIMKIANCDETHAKAIRQHINLNWLLDWSECEQSEFESVVINVNKELKK